MLNRQIYSKIRVRGTETFYTTRRADAFDLIAVNAASEGTPTLPGIGYYGEGEPSSSLGSNGNIYVDVVGKHLYQKDTTWQMLW